MVIREYFHYCLQELLLPRVELVSQYSYTLGESFLSLGLNPITLQLIEV